MLSGCYFDIREELIEDTIDDIIEIINAKYENRAYLSYLVSSIFATEQKTYKEYLGLKDNGVTELKLGEKRRNADMMIQKLKENYKKWGENEWVQFLP